MTEPNLLAAVPVPREAGPNNDDRTSSNTSSNSINHTHANDNDDNDDDIAKSKLQGATIYYRMLTMIW